ncbi:transcriptional regulator, TetR family [Jatrophihabitans endophyticus]|uniref:Transcriptional regulator, TetR family n=1 Tax=Jatrophihabitans endophyticus TaxID=1206085 RepID=A0A1M5HSX7_9ACTN|nr:TetR/AcrR family transcriptional regulator [Jatrophihabitans endophyticus]SHG19023.1 transcriptional regulator, TetR family [Jatrophihabitans endophyticus]
MTAAKRVRLSPEARRAQLIELGVELLGSRRLDELSVELIAGRAGISRGLLFHYFAGVQDFHLAVARAAAAEMLRRTEADPSLDPVAALRAAITAFVGYVEENPDSYRSLVRGAVGDVDMRAIVDGTRSAFAQRIVDAVGELGLRLSAAAVLAAQGWVTYAEECVLRWLDDRAIGRPALLEMLTRSLPAVMMAASDDDAAGLAPIFAAAIGGDD